MHHRRAFAKTELAALTIVGGVVLSLLIVGMHDSRRSAMLGRDLANLRQIGAWTNSYAADNQDLLWTFNWESHVQYTSPWPELNWAITDVKAAANQAVEILRRVADRPDMPQIFTWLPHLMYSHLVLVDYAGRPLPDQTLVSSGDAHRRVWAGDPAAFDQGQFLPYQPDPVSTAKRWPYSTSYQLPPAMFDRAQDPLLRVSQSSHMSWAVSSQASLGPAAVADVRHPSMKVHLHDAGAWHFGRPRYFADPDARTSLLFTDGAASARSTAGSNPGWHPLTPAGTEPLQFTYQPRAWDPPTPSGEPAEPATGHYRWTRGGLEGIDFGGPEINTGQR